MKLTFLTEDSLVKMFAPVNDDAGEERGRSERKMQFFSRITNSKKES